MQYRVIQLFPVQYFKTQKSMKIKKNLGFIQSILELSKSEIKTQKGVTVGVSLNFLNDSL